VMEELRGINRVAYVRFASVYREFQDVSEFLDELGPMLGGKKAKKKQKKKKKKKNGSSRGGKR